MVIMGNSKEKGLSEPIELYVSMTWGLKRQIDLHTALIGESNRSAWIREAIRSKLRTERDEYNTQLEATIPGD